MRATRTLTAVMVAAIVLCSPGAARAQGKVEDERDRPHDLILLVDVSLSMIMPSGPADRYPPNDREGIRWDGVQFTVDVARDHDRIALVLYRAENVVLTKYIDPSGFVRLAADYDWTDPRTGKAVKRKGRELLTELVAEVQRLEEKWAADIAARRARNEVIRDADYRTYALQLFAGRAGAKVDLAHGTASLLALQTVEKELLPSVRKGEARAWAFLFTDGEEEGRDTPGRQYPLATYDYIRQRRGLKGARLDTWLDPWTKAFRARGVPIFTFALGATCDLELLQRIALRSTPADQQATQAASYNPRSNVALLADLQQLQWELREYWKRPLGADRRDRGQEVFSTPEVQIWRDLGLLLYRVPARAAHALAPLPQHMQTPPRVGNRPLSELVPRRGRSHWYYAYPPPELLRAGPLPTGRLRLVVDKEGPPREEYTSHCVLALRTREPLFQYRDPAAGKKYTPRDAIPFRVDFTPYAVSGRAGKEVPFEAEDFDVNVTLTPAYRAGAAPARTFKLERDAPDPANPLAVRRFAKELVLDADPASKGKPALSGLYFVDVEIVGIQDPKKGAENPLRGAARRLLRRTLEVGPYPTLKLVPGQVVLTSDRAGGTAAEVKVELDMPTDPKQVETTLAVAVPRGPGLGKTLIDGARFELSPQPLTLRGRSGTLRIALPAKAWSGLPAGDYDAGRLTVQAPWQEKAVTAELSARKKAARLQVTPIVRLDLAARGKNATTREIPVALDTDLAVEETVWLSARNRPADEEPAELAFRQTEDAKGSPLKEGKSVIFQIAGLGRSHAVQATGADGKAKARLSFTLKHAGQLAPGVYRQTLYVVGPGVQAVPVTVIVAANQVSICDRAGNPLDEVYLLGLAGTDVAHTLTFRSALASRPIKAVTVRPNWPALTNVSPGGWDRLPLEVKEAGAERQVTLAVRVPPCVQEGEYGTEVTFEVTAAADEETQRVQVSLPVFVEVRHTGVRFRQQDLDLKGALWLRFPEGKTGQSAARDLDLITDAEKAPVRWSAERIKPKDGPGQALDAGDTRLDVLFKGRSVLTSGGDKAGGPRDPIRRDRPCPLTVRLSRQGLTPGLYRGGVRFHSREDRPEAGKGLVNDLEVYALVPGRDCEASSAGPSPYLGGEAELRVKLTCYDCPPEKGEIQPLDAAGKAVGPAVALTVPARSEPDPSTAGVVSYYYALKVTPPHVGKNVYEVRWPRYRTGEGPAEARTLTRRVTAVALGVIEVKPRIAGVNEDVLVRAKIDPAAAPENGAPLVLQLLNRGDKEAEAVPLELFDDGRAENGDERAGDGVYSARHRFPTAGVYEIAYPGAGAPGPLKATVVRVDYELQHADRLGTIEYGDGGWLSWLGIRAEVSDPQAVQLVNKRPERCVWRARLRFPEGGTDQRPRDEAGTLALPTTPDPRRHLDVRLTGPGAAKPGWALTGTLRQDEELDLGLDGKLSPSALEELAGNTPAAAGPHPTLGKTNTVFVELELEWLEDQGQSVGKRTVLTPCTIVTRHWAANPKPWLVGGLAAVLLFALARVGLRLVRRRPRAPAAAPAKAAPALATNTAPERPREPVPRPAPPRFTGGDEMPEHMRECAAGLDRALRADPARLPPCAAGCWAL